jgi:hypothetical protein
VTIGWHSPVRKPPQGNRRFDVAWLLETVSRFLLPAWFATLSADAFLGIMAHQGFDPIDARLYVDATRAWLSGADPWAVAYRGIYFAAPPPTLLAMVPFAVLPPPFGWLLLSVACATAAVATLVMLRLPWWWFLFPPLVNGVFSGNPQMLLVPLMLRGGVWLAAFLKVYAVVPALVLGQFRQLALFVGLLVVTAPFLPWETYLQNQVSIGGHLLGQSRYGFPVLVSVALFLPALIAFRIVGRPRAAWLAVPALWPMQQWYYGTLALPARSNIVGAVIALPVPGSGALALFALAVVEVSRHRSHRMPNDMHLVGVEGTSQ